MSSLLTNTSAMVALSNLRSINDDMAMTQNRISTGMRVNDASDNAAYWSIATTMRSDNKGFGAVEDALGLGAATIDVAFTSMNSAIETVKEIQAKLIAASDDGVDKAKIQSDITKLQEQLKTTADSAAFNGENWLSYNSGAATFNANASITGSFKRDAATGNLALQTIDVTKSELALYDSNGNLGILDKDRVFGFTGAATGDSVNNFSIAALGNNAADKADLQAITDGVGAALKEMTDAATSIGSTKKRVDMQKEFVSNLRDAIDRGIGQLVDADMNAESTRLKALQTQQQLGIQALSIANTGSQNILSLFR